MAKKKFNAKKAAKIAAGVTIAAGAVAAGIALSNPKTRKKVGKAFKRAGKKMREVAENAVTS